MRSNEVRKAPVPSVVKGDDANKATYSRFYQTFRHMVLGSDLLFLTNLVCVI